MICYHIAVIFLYEFHGFIIRLKCYAFVSACASKTTSEVDFVSMNCHIFSPFVVSIFIITQYSTEVKKNLFDFSIFFYYMNLCPFWGRRIRLFYGNVNTAEVLRLFSYTFFYPWDYLSFMILLYHFLVRLSIGIWEKFLLYRFKVRKRPARTKKTLSKVA